MKENTLLKHLNGHQQAQMLRQAAPYCEESGQGEQLTINDLHHQLKRHIDIDQTEQQIAQTLVSQL